MKKKKRVQRDEVASTEIGAHSEEYDYLITPVKQDEKPM